jgi:hypothetical protein
MKFLHLADLHLGKRVNGFDMLEDQRFILEQILTLCEKHGVEAVVIAGDIYDTPVPPAAACTLLKNSTTSILEIAQRCGYNNLSNFNRQFKERFGVSPRDYRNGRPEPQRQGPG